jgi:hypothetical protein
MVEADPALGGSPSPVPANFACARQLRERIS